MEILESRKAPLRIIKNRNPSINQALLHTPHSIELLTLSPLQYHSHPPFSIESMGSSPPPRPSMLATSPPIASPCFWTAPVSLSSTLRL